MKGKKYASFKVGSPRILTEFVVRNIIIAFKKVLPNEKCGMIRGTYVTNS